MPTHELQTPKGTPHPLLAAARVIEAIRARDEELAATEHPLVGAETYFVGEVHGGDFYNRFPTTCRIVGTRRWVPGNTLEAVDAEYRALLAPLAAETGCEIELDLRLVRGAYEIDPEHPLLLALQESYREVTGESLEPVGIKVVADGALFAAAGHPDRLPRPRRLGRARRRRVHAGRRSSCARREVYVALLRRLLT